MIRPPNSIRPLVLSLACSALSVGASAQNLGNLPNQTRLQRDLGLAINTVVCPTVAAISSRDDGTNTGDLFGRCNDLIHTANEINGSGATANSLNLTAEELNDALDSIAHTQVPAIGKGASEISVIQAGAISERLYALRAGARGVQIAARALDVDGQQIHFDSRELERMGAAGAEGIGEDPLGAFFNLRGAFGDRDSNSEELGFDYYDVGATVGLDYRFGEPFVGGLALGYSYADRDFDRRGGTIESSAVSGWMYGGFQQSGFYLDGLYGLSFHWIDSEREILIPIGPAPSGGAMSAIRTADGNTNAYENLLSATAGYQLEWGGLGIGPVTRIEYTRLDVDSFDETGAGGLSLIHESDDVESLIYHAGAEASFDISTGFGVLTPSVRAEWAHQFEDDQRTVTARYKVDPSNTQFFVQSQSPDRDYVDVAAGVTALFAGGFSAYANYETLLNHSDLTSHTITLGGRIDF